jgi:hypothetical protein
MTERTDRGVRRAARRIAAVAVAAGVVVAAVLPAPAGATPGSYADITSPADGSTLLRGWNGPVTITFFDAAPADGYTLIGQCFSEDGRHETWQEDRYFSWHGGGGTKTVESFASPPTGHECRLALWPSGEVWTETVFHLENPAPEVRDLEVGPVEFYPRVRDGYRDSVDVTFGAREDTAQELRVTDADGRTVYTRTLAPSGWCQDGWSAPTTGST